MPAPHKSQGAAEPSSAPSDARTLDTPSQDVAPTDEDIRLEAALVERRQHETTVSDFSEASRRLRATGDVDTPAPADADEEEDDDDEDEDDEDKDADR